MSIDILQTIGLQVVNAFIGLVVCNNNDYKNLNLNASNGITHPQVEKVFTEEKQNVVWTRQADIVGNSLITLIEKGLNSVLKVNNIDVED